MRRVAPRLLPLLLLAFVALTGCRAYGGYGTEEALANEMDEAVRLFAERLERARGDLQALNNAASGNPALQPLKDPYRAMVEVHEVTLERQRALAEAFTADDSYRGLHRAYGAVATQQRMIQRRYLGLHAQIAAAVRGEDLATVNMPSRAEYYIAPTFYQRVENARNELTMQQALRGGRVGS
jgi:hypothetical protein